jgi:hypothetical protein
MRRDDMKKLILPMALLALIAVPATADASPCRNAKGQFAKCGTPGALPAGAKAAPAMKAGPAMAPAMKAGPAMAAKPAAGPAMAPVKKGPCKDSKGKFVKC